MRNVSIFLISVVCLLCSNSAFAIKQYRCNGRVQYRPCDMESQAFDQPSYSHPAEKARWTPSKHKGNIRPRVFDDTFERSSDSQGIWRGHVAGDGIVFLKLYIYERGRLLLTREIGSVELWNETTYFAFESPLPKGDRWTWVIKASY